MKYVMSLIVIALLFVSCAKPQDPRSAEKPQKPEINPQVEVEAELTTEELELIDSLLQEVSGE